MSDFMGTADIAMAQSTTTRHRSVKFVISTASLSVCSVRRSLFGISGCGPPQPTQKKPFPQGDGFFVVALTLRASVRLEIFQQRHAICFGQIGTPEMATISLAGLRGVDEAVLLTAGGVDDEAELHRVILTTAEGKGLGTLLGRK